MKKLNFFIDIDGTLLAEVNGKISDTVISAIREAKRDGHTFFINTARPFWMVPEKTFPSDVFDGICSGCGTYISYHGKAIYQSFISDEALKTLFTDIESYGMADFSSIIESFETTYYHGPKRPEYSLLGYKKLGAAKNIGATVNNIKAQKFSFYKTADELPASLLNKLQEKLSVMQHPTYLEVAQKGFSKAAAIKLTENVLNIPHETTVAIGDSMNDEEMLKYASVSVAMGNAPEKLKAFCDLVTDTAENDGVAKAVKALTSKQI